MEEKQTYTTQLQTIKAIQHNLSLLKTRINFLQKQEIRTAHNFSKVFQSSIPLIKSKINNGQKQNKIKSQQYEELKSKNKKEEQIKQNKINHLLQLNKSKIQVKKDRINGSFYIKQMSRKNMHIIEQAKKSTIEEKKRKNQLIRSYKLQSKRKLQQYHTQKQKQYQQARQQQARHLQARIHHITKQLANITKVQEQQFKRYQKNDQSVKNLRDLMQHIQHMKHSQFQKILERLSITAESVLDEKKVELILLQVEKNFQEGQKNQQLERFSLYQQAKIRYESESSDVSTIYGQKYQIRKIK